LPDEIFRVRSVLPFFATVMVFLLTSTVLVTASPMVKFTTRCWVRTRRARAAAQSGGRAVVSGAVTWDPPLHFLMA
jgi:hypothetical protein